MKKTVFVRLKRIRGGDAYRIEQLRNSAQVSLSPPGKPTRFFRVGDEVTPEQADALCMLLHYDVTVNN